MSDNYTELNGLTECTDTHSNYSNNSNVNNILLTLMGGGVREIQLTWISGSVD